MSKAAELAKHLNELNIDNMFRKDFYWTWDKTDDEIEAIFTVFIIASKRSDRRLFRFSLFISMTSVIFCRYRLRAHVLSALSGFRRSQMSRAGNSRYISDTRNGRAPRYCRR